MAGETPRLQALRNRVFHRLCEQVGGITLNGPSLDRPELRLAANLNVAFSGIDAESLLATARGLALSAGSACDSNEPEPSHVLRALGLPDPTIRSSVRFGLGRSTTDQQIDQAVHMLATAARRLRSMLPVVSRCYPGSRRRYGQLARKRAVPQPPGHGGLVYEVKSTSTRLQWLKN